MLRKEPNHVKQLNIGYNQLKGGRDFHDIIEQELDVKWNIKHANESQEFLEVMSNYLLMTGMLNHLDLSGLDLMELAYEMGTQSAKDVKCTDIKEHGEHTLDQHHFDHSHKRRMVDVKRQRTG